MDTSSERLSLSPHLKGLYDSFQLLGFSNFTFDPSTRRAIFSRNRSQISRATFKTINALYGGLLFWNLVTYLIQYTNLIQLYIIPKSVDAQDKILLAASSCSTTLIGVLIVARYYLARGHTIVPVVNEMFEIFELLASKSDSTVFFLSSAFGMALIWKVTFCSIVILDCARTAFLLSFMFLFNAIMMYGKLLVVVTYFSYMYSQLVLVCFYIKMNDFLETACFQMSGCEFTMHVRELFALSFRIHRVKRTLNALFSGVFLATYFALFADIYNLYDFLKLIMYRKFSNNLILKIVEFIWHFRRALPLMLSVSYDLYLIGRLSDMLVQEERSFEQRIMLLFCRRSLARSKSLNREIEDLMVRNNFYDLNSRTCKIVKLDQQFTFNFITNIVFVYVINCLQFYASEMTYPGTNLVVFKGF